jgi:hypothetical protein
MIYGLVWFATPNVDTLVWGLVGLGLGSLCNPERSGPVAQGLQPGCRANLGQASV